MNYPKRPTPILDDSDIPGTLLLLQSEGKPNPTPGLARLVNWDLSRRFRLKGHSVSRKRRSGDVSIDAPTDDGTNAPSFADPRSTDPTERAATLELVARVLATCSPQERAVMLSLARGESAKEAAPKLEIAPATVYVHIAHVRARARALLGID